MPRIRTIKPEFCTSPDVVRCSRDARLCFVLLWMFADDGGVLQASSERLQYQLFPGDDDATPEKINEWVSELIAAGLLVEFEAEGAEWWAVTGWKRHQRIEKAKPRFPQLSAEVAKTPRQLHDCSMTAHGVVGECSPLETETEKEKERGKETEKETDLKRSTKKRRSGNPIDFDEIQFPSDFDDQAREALDRWVHHHKAIGRPYKNTKSLQTLLKRFDGRAGDFVAAVEFSIGNNYQGLIEEKKGPRNGRAKNTAGQEYKPEAAGTW